MTARRVVGEVGMGHKKKDGVGRKCARGEHNDW